MEIVCKLNRSTVETNRAHALELLVKLVAPRKAPEGGRRLVNVMPVVDVSGSMQGRKLAAVRHALRKLAEHLVPGDRVGLVTFETEVRVLLPLVELTETWRSTLLDLVNGLESASQTNMGGGLLAAMRLVGETKLLDTERARLVLLTDGLANCGPATTREGLLALVERRHPNVSVSAFGYGNDCDQTLLSDLADKGGGSFAYIQNDDAVLTAFARELGGLVSTCATDVEVIIESEEGSPLREKPGDILYGSSGLVLAPIRVLAHGEQRGFTAARVKVRWRDGLGRVQEEEVEVPLSFAERGDTVEDAEVVRARDERRLRLAQEKAEELARRGRMDEAFAHLNAVLGSLATPALARFVREELLPAYHDEQSYSSSGGTRASSLSALKRKKAVTSAAAIEAVFEQSVATGPEQEMERRFRGKK